MTDDNNNNSNNNSDRHHQHYLSESSSPSLTDPNYLQNQGSNLDTTEGNESKGTTTTTTTVYQKDTCRG